MQDTSSFSNETKSKLSTFINLIDKNSKLVLITAGGCDVRLEKNTVRQISNFSTGKRGSLSAEYFLKKGYYVIYFHYSSSLKPYFNRIDQERLLESKYLTSDFYNQIMIEYEKYSSRLLFLDYKYIEEYIERLYFLVNSLSSFNSNLIIFLSAAISDYYIPSHSLSEHKIQSKSIEGQSITSLSIKLEAVKKEIYLIKESLCPSCLLVSFKLETDKELLESKSINAIVNTKSDIVVGNILEKRYDEVILYSNKKIVYDLVKGYEECQVKKNNGVNDEFFYSIKIRREKEKEEIEERLVDVIVINHV